jgi:nucleotide-binding universal stress UspA family protein
VHYCWLQIPYKVEVARSCVDCDSIGELVCKRAQKLNAAVLLMAKHKRGALKEFFIGSVSNYALHHCKQPVLVLHGQ